MAGSFRKYLNICRVSLSERLAYRGDFILATVLRFLPLLTTVLLWEAIFAGSEKDELAGFTYRNMIAYLLLVHISRMFSSMPGLSTGIARDIRHGDIKKYLIQPIDMIGFLLAYRVAHKLAYIATSGIPYAGLFAVCHGYFDGLPEPATLGIYVATLFLGFVIGFFFETMMGMLGFWMLEVTSLLYIVNTINFFVSGHMFPLDLLPGPLASVLRALPFPYLAYFPAAVFLEKITGPALIEGLLVGLAWALAFILLSRWLHTRGLRRYSAFGG
ncbi:MAG TPA: ABC-2 family transporter protein [Gemmatales bacterium]|nr:ABC-2 family transporter protein [Gemmatales bacterium]HMP59417.1 ABC-2 family transporter protein [Gemmatales bacterium]